MYSYGILINQFYDVFTHKFYSLHLTPIITIRGTIFKDFLQIKIFAELPETFPLVSLIRL